MSIKEEIVKLEELRIQLQRVRKIPRGLLQGGRSDFETIKMITEAVGSSGVQEALNRAMASLKADGTGLSPKRTKRKRGPTTEEYVEEDRQETSLLPSCAEKGITPAGLVDWARVYNTGNRKKLRLRANRVRFTIPDVLTVYMSIGGADEINVETIRAFGPREKTDGQGQSQYMVFQLLSQQLTLVLEREAPVKFQTVVRLLEAYQDLFSSTCLVCARILAGSGHVPPLIRSYDGSGWRVCHIGCIM